MFGDCGVFAALHHLSGQLEAARSVIERDCCSDRLGCALFAGGESILYQIGFEVRRLGVLERRKIGFKKLSWSRRENFDWRTGVEGHMLHRLAFSAAGLE